MRISIPTITLYDSSNGPKIEDFAIDFTDVQQVQEDVELFTNHVRGILLAELRDAVVHQSSNRLRPILNAVEKGINKRAGVIRAKYWDRFSCYEV